MPVLRYCMLVLAAVFVSDVAVVGAQLEVSEEVEAQTSAIAQDRLIVRGLFRSLAGKSDNQKRQIIREITLYQTNEQVRRQEVLPGLARIFLGPQESRDLRREAAKALLTVGGEREFARPILPLLMEDRLSVGAALEAIWQIGDAIFLLPVVQTAREPTITRELRRQALLTMLSLWPTSECDAATALLAKPPTPENQPPENPALDPLVKRDAKRIPDNPALEGLREIARGEITSLDFTVRLKALLVLGCLKQSGVLPLLHAAFPKQQEPQRYQIARFLGLFRHASSIPALGQCSRSDASTRLRYTCSNSLAAIGSNSALQQLQRTYFSSDKKQRRLLVDLLADSDAGQQILEKLLAKEQRTSMRAYLKRALKVYGPHP